MPAGPHGIAGLITSTDAHVGLAAWISGVGTLVAVISTSTVAIMSMRESKRAAWRTEREMVRTCFRVADLVLQGKSFIGDGKPVSRIHLRDPLEEIKAAQAFAREEHPRGKIVLDVGA